MRALHFATRFLIVLCRVDGEGVQSVAHDERTRAEVVHAACTDQVCTFGGRARVGARKRQMVCLRARSIGMYARVCAGAAARMPST